MKRVDIRVVRSSLSDDLVSLRPLEIPAGFHRFGGIWLKQALSEAGFQPGDKASVVSSTELDLISRREVAYRRLVACIAGNPYEADKGRTPLQVLNEIRNEWVDDKKSKKEG